MSILDAITVSVDEAPRITIYGVGGIGKSTLASNFPDPLFILTEKTGLSGIKKINPPANFVEMWENIKSLLALEELPFKTIVIDGLSKLDELIVNHILDKEVPGKNGKATSLATACGGYGAGFQAAQQIHRSFKAMMDKFQRRDVTVIYIGHLTTIKYKAPDMEDYDKYSITMNSDKCREPYINDVDAVLLCRTKSFVTETESGRSLIRSTGNLIIDATINDAHVSKNRFGIKSEIPMSFEELSKYIPFYNKFNEDELIKEELL